MIQDGHQICRFFAETTKRDYNDAAHWFAVLDGLEFEKHRVFYQKEQWMHTFYRASYNHNCNCRQDPPSRRGIKHSIYVRILIIRQRALHSSSPTFTSAGLTLASIPTFELLHSRHRIVIAHVTDTIQVLFHSMASFNVKPCRWCLAMLFYFSEWAMHSNGAYKNKIDRNSTRAFAWRMHHGLETRPCAGMIQLKWQVHCPVSSDACESFSV